jgi:peptide/nickel transport system substrate-binding protein
MRWPNLTRRSFVQTAAAAMSGVATPAFAQSTEPKTLRMILQSDLRILDPIVTTVYATRDHAYMVFDTLFALDDKLVPHPQMVGDYSISADKLTYDFALRPELRFHDGSPVRGADCTASLQRWMARDVLGQAIAASMDEMAPTGDTSFRIKLKSPFPLLLAGIGKVSTVLPVIMPERLAKTDPYTQVTEMIGSGPFKWVAAEHQPGYRYVWVKNTDYVPRSEPPNWATGAKIAKVDRVEWRYIPDSATAAAALGNGEVDWWDNPPSDFWPMLNQNPDINVVHNNLLGQMTMMRFNHLQPPFDNVKMRQALLAVIDQKKILPAIAGDPENWSVCASFFTCGAPMSNDAGSEAQTSPRDFDRAKALIAEAGYNGEPIVVLDASDNPNSHMSATIIVEDMKKLGLNVDFQAMDWGTMITRRNSREPPDKGGWNIFCTGWAGIDQMDPSQNQALRANGDKAWFGWPTDPELESLRARWLVAPTQEEQRTIAVQIQKRAYEVVPYVPLGRYTNYTALRRNLKGMIISPMLLMYNVEKV